MVVSEVECVRSSIALGEFVREVSRGIDGRLSAWQELQRVYAVRCRQLGHWYCGWYFTEKGIGWALQYPLHRIPLHCGYVWRCMNLSFFGVSSVRQCGAERLDQGIRHMNARPSTHTHPPNPSLPRPAHQIHLHGRTL